MEEPKGRQQQDGGQAAIPLAADVDGTSSGSMPDSIPPILLKK